MPINIRTIMKTSLRKTEAENHLYRQQQVNISPGGMYWQDPVAFTRTFVWNVASNLSSALQGQNRTDSSFAFSFFFFKPVNSKYTIEKGKYVI